MEPGQTHWWRLRAPGTGAYVAVQSEEIWPIDFAFDDAQKVRAEAERVIVAVGENREITLGVKRGGGVPNHVYRQGYTFTIEETDVKAGIVIRCDTERGAAFRVVTNEVAVNDGLPIVLRQGEVFRQYFTQPLTGFNILDSHSLDNSNPQTNDQGFSFSIPAGREQLFVWGEFGQSFNQTNLFSN